MHRTTYPGAWAPKLITAFLACLLLAAPAHAVTLERVSGSRERNRRVYDFAGVLSRSEIRSLHDQLAAMEQSGLAEPVIVLLDRTEGATVEEYALALGERWKVGRRDTDNGLIFVASVQDRKRFLSVGYDLETLLPDAVAARIQREDLVPAFREGRYAAGLQAMIQSIHTTLERAGGTEALPTRPAAPAHSSGLAWLTLFLGLGTAATGFRAFPRGKATAGLRFPTILLGFGSLASGIFAAGQGSPALPMVLLGLPAGAFAAARLSEGAWLPLPLEEARQRITSGMMLYAGLMSAIMLIWLFAFPNWWLVGFLLVAIPLGFAVHGYLSRAPRRCPQCAGALRWLAEQDEAPSLTAGENAEQQIGSLDYDVWRCDNCHRSAVMVRKAGPAVHAQCPRCHRRTLTSRMVLDRNDRGYADEIIECRNPECGHTDMHRRRVGRSWGDMDDGFGGGGLIFIPPIFGGGWGGSGGQQGDAGGWGGDSGGDFGGIDVGDFGGGGGFGGGGAGGDW